MRSRVLVEEVLVGESLVRETARPFAARERPSEIADETRGEEKPDVLLGVLRELRARAERPRARRWRGAPARVSLILDVQRAGEQTKDFDGREQRVALVEKEDDIEFLGAVEEAVEIFFGFPDELVHHVR